MSATTHRMLIVSHNSALYWKAVDLRTKILRIPLGLKFTQEELLKENDQLHFVCVQNEEVIAALSLKPLSSTNMKMRQVAVDDTVQKTGIGKKLVTFSEDYARNNGYTMMECNARNVAAPFYLKLGYKTEGDEFLEVNIPHFRMTKALR